MSSKMPSYIPLFLFSGFLCAQSPTVDQSIAHIQNQEYTSSSSQELFNAAGNWRAVFKINATTEVPVNFLITTEDGKQKLYFLNGDEKFESGSVQQTRHSIFVTLDPFDNELALGISNGVLNGVLRRQNKTGVPTPVVAERNKNYRFESNNIKPAADFSGTYDISFSYNDGQTEKAVGLFTQKGNQLTATFLRITGDSRFLQGTVEGNQFYLSSFIGSGPAFYRGSFTSDGKLNGANVNARGETKFTGVLNEEAALPDPEKLTYLRQGYKTLDIAFPDANGKIVSLKDARYKNKVVIITITGTWCPNCIDEAFFLAPWYKQNKSRGVEVLALHYERQTDSAYVRKALTKFRNKYGIEYEQLIAGTSDKKNVAASIPALNTFLSFPTIIILDKKGNVAKIHTGFSGPATGKYYTEFVKDFNETITALLNEKN